MDEAVERALAEARALGFLGPGPLEAHATSAAAFAVALGALTGVGLDLGSGGGVPGLLLAASYPDVAWVLLDASRRRTSFLARAVAGLGWAGRVSVVRQPAEVAAHVPRYRAAFDAVVARSFAPAPITAECAAGFLRVGGRLAVAEPPKAPAERWNARGLESLGLVAGPVADGRGVAVFTQAAPAADDVPRAWRAMQRSPRW